MKAVIALLMSFGIAMCHGTPIRASAASKHIQYVEDGGDAWTNPYVTDGLVVMWDGIWNAGGGIHSDYIEDFVELMSGQSALAGYEYGNSSVIPDTPVFTVEQDGVRSNMSSGQSNVGIALPFPIHSATWEYTIEYVRTIHKRTNLGLRCVVVGSYPSVTYVGTLGSQTWAGWNALAWYSGIWTVGLVEPIGGGSISVVGTNSGRTFIVHEVGTATNSRGQFSVGSNTHVTFASAGSDCTLNCIRIYNRALSAEEIEWNHAIDAERFNIP